MTVVAPVRDPFSDHSLSERFPQPPITGVWEDAIPEGTPLSPMAHDRARELHPFDPERARQENLTRWAEDWHDEPAAVPVRETAPNLMSTFKQAEEAAMTHDPDAPWGRKKDGTPKARPGRRPDAERAAAELAAPPATAVAPEPTEPEPPCTAEEPCEDTTNCVACGENLTPAATDLDVAIERLNGKMGECDDRIRAIDAEIAELRSQAAELDAERNRVRLDANRYDTARTVLLELTVDEALELTGEAA